MGKGKRGKEERSKWRNIREWVGLGKRGEVRGVV